MSSSPASMRTAQQLRPEVIRNDMLEKLTQLDYIQMGENDGTYASAMSTFPMVNMDDPDEAVYTWDVVAGPMAPSSYDAESPLGSISAPDIERYTTHPYKKKIRPDKGMRSRFKRTPFSVSAAIVQKLNLELWLTREQVTWRGDDLIDGLIGKHGQSKHPEIPTNNDDTVSNPWSDETNAEPFKNITNAVARVVDNGVAGGNSAATPLLYGSPGAIRDLKQTQDMEDRVKYVRIRSLDTDTIQEIIDEELGGIRRVRVQIPRKNAAGQYIDAEDNPVDTAAEAKKDNVLEPYDPETGETHRCVVIGRPGAGSAFMPWFLEDLLDFEDEIPPHGEMAIDETNGFFTQRYTSNDPVGTTVKAGQDVGFRLERPENWQVLRNI